MKSCHDIVSIVGEEALGPIRECYSIPEVYVLRPYNVESSEISISVDALEVSATVKWFSLCIVSGTVQKLTGLSPRPPSWGRDRKDDLAIWALLLAPNIGVIPQYGVLSQPGEESRVRKVASVDNCDTPGSTSGWLLCEGSVRSSYTKALAKLLELGRAPLTIKDVADWSARRDRPLSEVPRAGRPVAFGLPRCQPPVGRGAVGWSARCACSALPPASCRRGCCHVTDRPLAGTLRVGQD
ncbi:hypothetical protein BHE74_00053177 [Ensete ventricosum]|nr:hypothetical protein BHE74_00053177 [Ensete ventricosum]